MSLRIYTLTRHSIHGCFFVVWFHPPLSDIGGLKHSAIRASSRFHVWRTGHPPIMRICQSLGVTKNDCWDNQNTVHPNTILHYSGQIIATSHDLGPQNVAFWKGNPIISGKSLVKYDFIWPDYCLAVATETNFPVKMVRFVHWNGKSMILLMAFIPWSPPNPLIDPWFGAQFIGSLQAGRMIGMHMNDYI